MECEAFWLADPHLNSSAEGVRYSARFSLRVFPSSISDQWWWSCSFTAKMLMMIESAISLLTLVIVAARAVNVLP